MDPDQTARMRRLVCIRSGRKRMTLVLSWRSSIIVIRIRLLSFSGVRASDFLSKSSKI
jgi:hypothetical protein